MCRLLSLVLQESLIIFRLIRKTKQKILEGAESKALRLCVFARLFFSNLKMYKKSRVAKLIKKLCDSVTLRDSYTQLFSLPNLLTPHSVIQTFLNNQIFMFTLLDDFTLFQDKNSIGVHYS